LKFKINEGPKDLVLKNTKTYCATDNPTIASLSDTKIFSSGALKWYSSETDTNVLSVGTNLTSGTYFASATLTPGCESVARQSVVVMVQTFGQTTLDLANTYEFCKGSNKTIADLSTKPYFSNEIVWLNGNKVVQTPGMGLLPGTYFATETKNGCVSPNAQQIEVKFTTPIISITPSKLPTCGAGNGVFVITGADTTYTYQWSKDGQVMTEKGSQIKNLVDDQSIKYSVIVTDTKGCIALDTAMFTDCDPAEIPHIITPNDDGKNDKFVLNYESKYPKCSLTIFNRWGAAIYETKEVPYKDDWDGKPNVGGTLGTNVLPAGTYFYMIEKGDGTTPESGYVELVK
jgi:gliding motility-associated-like protein